MVSGPVGTLIERVRWNPIRQFDKVAIWVAKIDRAQLADSPSTCYRALDNVDPRPFKN